MPIGASLSWAPSTGNEPTLGFIPGFHPKWYNKKLGIDFSERWHTDPVYRYGCILRMKQYVHMLFPRVKDFEPVYDGNAEVSCATIAGVFGVMLIPMIYGFKPAFKQDARPDAEPGSVMTKEQIATLEPFDLENSSVIQMLLKQMDIIQEKYGKVRGFLDYQGILNVAFKLRGSEIFIDMVESPELVHKLLTHIAQTIMGTAKLIQKRQRQSGYEINMMCTCNCVVNMISPKMYEEILLPYDIKLSKEFDYFGVHTCNWNVTPYIDTLRKIEKVGYIDMGASSNLEEVRRQFLDARRTVLMSPVFFSLPWEKQKVEIDRIAELLTPCDIAMGAIDDMVPSEDVNRMLMYILNHKVN
jgi:hypothetical protein